MQLFGRLVDAGATVVEVGGHIGWISSWLASCVGPGGRVFVFEPGSNNLPYTRINLSEGLPAHLSAVVRLVEAAVGEKEDIVSFYEDALTGQNNSIVENFEGLNANQSMAFVDANVQRRVVRLVSLDSQLPEEAVSFVKVDVEGYEWGVLQGAKKLIDRCLPSMMVEVQCNHDEIFSYLTDMGYILFDPSLKLLSSADALQSNVFCLHRVKHKTQISELGILLS